MRKVSPRLGIRKENASLLVEALRQAAKSDARLVKETEYGTLYAIDFELTTGYRNAWVRSGWIVRLEENFPRLTTCYIPRK